MARPSDNHQANRAPATAAVPRSGIRDNCRRGSVGDFYRQHLQPGADLDLVAAYFTVFAYDGLRAELNRLNRTRLLFGEAAFIKGVDPQRPGGAAYVLRVEAGMALVDLTATQTDNPLDEQQLEDLITADLRLRDRQLERLKKEVLDLEDLDDTVTLADFSLDDFRLDLLRYLQANRDRLENAPLGLYAVVPPAAPIPMARPGVVFCLRHKGKPEVGQNEKVKPLAPYYLVFVHADGQVRLTFTQSKTILKLFRELALGRTEPSTDLCRLFDRQTQQGRSMGLYSGLLSASVAAISATFQQKLAAELRHDLQFILPTLAEQVCPNSEFELVTWLVILDGGQAQ